MNATNTNRMTGHKLTAIVITALLAGPAGCASSTAAGSSHPSTSETHRAPAGDVAENLMPGGTVRRQVLAAAAARRRVPAADFKPLTPSTMLYAYDFTRHTHWAAAELNLKRRARTAVPLRAATLDVFKRVNGKAWKDVDLNAASHGPRNCPVPLPAGVEHRWKWSPRDWPRDCQP